jgi:hypothetical protein
LYKKETDTIFVLGNGPSLKHQLDNPDASRLLALNTCICVNSFILTGYYDKIKPAIYLLVDPSYFTSVSVQETEEEHLLVWENLINKTTWEMDIIISSQYKNNNRVNRLRENKNINVLFFNQSDCSICLNKKEQFRLFNKNRLEVPAQTVLNTALYLCIFWRYKNIVLLGADTSWHEEIRVDQKTNILFFENRHFYKSKEKILYNDAEETIRQKIHEQFYSIARAFELYWLLREYAEFNSVKVFNASTRSYIDAFERISLDEFHHTHLDNISDKGTYNLQ